jgi:uncharacterized protein YfiM (DUF2279 family)
MGEIMLLLFLLNSDSLNKNYYLKVDTVKKIVRDNWFSEDKFFHFSVSALLVGSSYHFLKCRINKGEKLSTISSLSSTFLLGIFKEVYDKKVKKEYFSYKDLIYDILGIGCGYLIFIH